MPIRAGTRGNGGFTLIEVLVSLVILSVGMLALGQLFWFASRTSSDSFMRTMAHTQALDMGERMWLDLNDPLGQVDAWQDSHAGSAAGWSGEAAFIESGEPGLVRIRIRWEEAGAQDPMEYEYRVRLPVIQP